ncbi:MAG: hypothetical protein J6Y20_00645, partial [Lachnospiraceae bacterium]|nr:hypothetical protein [Lachnospiraceae bacterium]
MAKKKLSDEYNEQEEELREEGDSDYTADDFEPEFMRNDELSFEDNSFEELDMDLGLTDEDAMLLDEADAPDTES